MTSTNLHLLSATVSKNARGIPSYAFIHSRCVVSWVSKGYVQRENALTCQTHGEMQTAQCSLYCVTLTQMMLLSAHKQTHPYRDSEYVNSRNHTVTASFPLFSLHSAYHLVESSWTGVRVSTTAKPFCNLLLYWYYVQFCHFWASNKMHNCKNTVLYIYTVFSGL